MRGANHATATGIAVTGILTTITMQASALRGTAVEAVRGPPPTRQQIFGVVARCY